MKFLIFKTNLKFQFSDTAQINETIFFNICRFKFPIINNFRRLYLLQSALLVL